MKALTIAAAVALLASESIEAAPESSSLLRSAKEILLTRLVDPESLQLRSTRVVEVEVDGEKRPTVCGEFNAKNRLGGFVGFRAFVYEPSSLRGVMTFDRAMTLAFYSSDGQLDLDQDIEGALEAGVSAESLVSETRRIYNLAEYYIPACIGAK